MLFIFAGACASSTGDTGASSTGGSASSSGSGTSSSGGACTNVGSCYGSVQCPVGSVCVESTFVCCEYDNGQGSSSGAARGSSSGGSSTTAAGGSSSGGSSGVVSPYSGGWPKWHYDNANQGLSPADTSGNTGIVLWKFNVGLPQTATGQSGLLNPNPTYMNSPVVDENGTVYQLGMSGTLYALGDGGQQYWTTPLLPPNPDEHPATPMIANRTLYLTTGSDGASPTTPAQLYHLDAATGKILYQAGPPLDDAIPADGFDASPSIGYDGLLFDGDDSGPLLAYKVDPSGSFAQANELRLIFAGSDRLAVALDESDNSYWCCSSSCFGVTSPAAGFTVMPGWTSTGARIGTAPINVYSTTNSDLAYDQNHTGWLMVEAGNQNGDAGSTEVVAMDPSDGSTHWDTKLPSGPAPTSFAVFSSNVGNSAPAIGPGGTVYVGNVDGLYLLDGQTGSILSTYRPSQDTGANADVDTAVAIGGDGTLFFGTAGGTFYAVTSAGTERFHYTTGGRISSSPAIGPDGTVFFVSDDGYLYAIR